jgi:tetratricopeptide (TPR) repeat protein
MRFYLLNVLLFLLGDLFSQKSVIDSAIDSADVKIEKYFNTAISDSLRMHYKAQIIHMDKYIAKDSLNPKAFLQRGIYHGQLGFQVEAIADYDQSIALDSSGSVAYFNRGLAKARFRYTYDACFDLKKALSLGIEAAENIYKSCCSLYHSEIDNMILNQKK